MSLLEIKDVSKTYRNTPALNGVTLSLEAGQIVALLGDNGAGKTTLMKCIAGLITDYSGEIRVADNPIGVESKKMVSFLPDRLALPNNITWKKAISFYQRFFSDFDEVKARDLMEFFRLPADKKIREYSKGMQEKLQIGLTIARQAQVYLLDEPLSGVDPAARDVILRGMLENYNPEAIFLISTHLIQDIENLVETVIFMHSGQILLVENADELRAKYNSSIDNIFRKAYAS